MVDRGSPLEEPKLLHGLSMPARLGIFKRESKLKQAPLNRSGQSIHRTSLLLVGA